MNARKPMTKLFIAAALGVTALLATTGSAFAGVADYPSTATFGVPNNTGQAGLPSQVFVPPGRTPVQSRAAHPGHAELRRRRRPGPPAAAEGPERNRDQDADLVGCTTYPNTSAFTITRLSRPFRGSPLAFCTALTGIADDGQREAHRAALDLQRPAERWRLDGHRRRRRAPARPWGSWNGWTLQINHANPTLKADPAPFKIKKKFAISALCNANCTVTTGGAAGATTTQLVANSVGTIVAPALKKAQKKGKGVVTLTATDETGGTATTTVNAKTIKVKKKAKK